MGGLTLRVVLEVPGLASARVDHWQARSGVLAPTAHIRDLASERLEVLWTAGAEAGDWWGRPAPSLSEPPAPAPALLAVIVEPEPGLRPAVERWYDGEHLPRLREVPGVLWAHRFESLSDPGSYLVLYLLAEPAVPAGEAWQRAADSPATRRFRDAWRRADRVLATHLPPADQARADT
jgi:hypothetical protein